MYAVIGGNGFLGSYIIKNILEETEEMVLATATNLSGLEDSQRVRWQKCNILDEAEFDGLVEQLKSYSSVKVIFLVAYHHPDMVAANPQYAWNVNVTTLSKCVNKLHFAQRLFYASTDSVYGNSPENYHFKEDDVLNPVNIYGRNKAAAEAVIQYSGFHVVRYPFLIGTSLAKGKVHFYDRIVADLMAGKRVEMFSDSYRSSLDFNTAANLMIKLCEHQGDLPSIVNICGDTDLSKYDVGKMIAHKLNCSEELVVPITIAEGADIFKSARATSTLMDNSLLKKTLQLDSIELTL